MKTRFLGAASLALLTAFPAHAQEQRCAPTQLFHDALSARFGEVLIFQGIANGGGAIVEVWANGESETWTLLATLPNGLSCQLAEGEGLESIGIIPSGDPA